MSAKIDFQYLRDCAQLVKYLDEFYETDEQRSEFLDSRQDLMFGVRPVSQIAGQGPEEVIKVFQWMEEGVFI